MSESLTLGAPDSAIERTASTAHRSGDSEHVGEDGGSSALKGTSVLEPELARVPRDWSRRKLKYLTQESRVKYSDDQTSAQMLSVSGYDGVVPKQYEDANQMRSETDLADYLVVKPRQLAVNCMWLNYCGLGVSTYDGLISPAYRVYDLGEHLHPSFCHYLLRSNHYVGEYTRLGYGIRPNSLQVSRGDFGDLPIPFPPLPTQTAIANFLDRKTAAIDALIAKKRRLVELLAEKRAALINCAVTKGLDPTVPMKDSGIPWIGEIPAHWDVKRLKTSAEFVTSGPRGWGQYYSETGPTFLRIGNVSRIGIDLLLGDLQRVQPPASAEGVRTRAVPGDLLVTITADIGSVGIVPDGLGETYVSQHVALARTRDSQVSSRFLAYALKSPWGQLHFQESMQGGTKLGLNLDDVRNVPFGCPPMEEQDRIARFLDGINSSLSVQDGLLAKQLLRLQEYRQALITAAVTGQLEIPVTEPEEVSV